ncbi:nuclear transport factor 2 family protein [Elioraea sp.]|uniref:nuclear transport factor 2 family protein n=1 Tax=Elioraea sp. TaxID=2185103 RepID=UPI0025C525B3|nr:nuclear transport factor 2 family protein [Elioraea sp.]
MTTREVAEAFAALCKAGRFEEAGERFWAASIVSIEPMEGPMARLEGIDAVKGKSTWWYANHEVHAFETHGPYINRNQFALRFCIEVTAKATGQRLAQEEIALYTVADGRVVEERFLS